MYIQMKRWLSVLWFYVELIPGFAFIGAGFFELFIADPGSQICIDNTICAVDSLSFIMPSLSVCSGMMVIIIWYLTTYLPFKEKESQFVPSVKPEDFVK